MIQIMLSFHFPFGLINLKKHVCGKVIENWHWIPSYFLFVPDVILWFEKTELSLHCQNFIIKNGGLPFSNVRALRLSSTPCIADKMNLLGDNEHFYYKYFILIASYRHMSHILPCINIELHSCRLKYVCIVLQWII